MVAEKRRRFALLALALLATPALAASVQVQTRPQYTRMLFNFDKATKLQLGGGGKTLILTFDHPVEQPMAALTPQLANVATSVEQSEDGKKITIALKDSYRVRQFVSGKTVGVDVLGTTTAPQENIPAAKSPPAEPAPEVKKPEPKKPEPKPEVKVFKPEPILTTKHEEPTPAPEPKLIKPQEPKPEAIKPEPSPVLTTKHEEPAPAPVEEKPEPKPETKAEPEKNPILTTKEEPPAPEVNPVEAVEPIKPEVKEEAKSEEPKAESPKAEEESFSVVKGANDATFMVTAQNKPEGTVIDFPWTARTAASVFERAGDIWIIFSEQADAKPAMLLSVMPKSVVRVEQFAYSGYTILRLVTDGTIHATAEQPKGSYAWQILLSNQKPAPALDIAVTGEKDEDKTFLQFAVFDTTEPVRFYDPTVGDLIIAVPVYELGRGVAYARDLPEFSIFATQQGIALISKREDVKVERSRLGVRLLGDTPLAVSQNLPVIKPDAAPVPNATSTADVMMPYDQWYVEPKKFRDEYERRLQAIMTASPAQVPGTIERMAQLYLGAGLAGEAKGYLDRIATNYPDYYRDHKLALLHTACNIMLGHTDDAALDLDAPELVGVDEANLWREIPPLYTPRADTVTKIQEEVQNAENEDPNATAAQGAAEQPAPLPEFHFMDYNKSYIRFYPPRMRQRLAVIAADSYIEAGDPEKAVNVYDSLNADGILDPVQKRAELALGITAEKKEKTKEALRIFDGLAKQQDDIYVQARARAEAALLRYNKGMLPADQVTEELEMARIAWRNGKFERNTLYTLAQIYKDNKEYDATLRSWKTLITAFPDDPDLLAISANMGQLFEDLFLNGLADQMPPLKSLGLFYEFRELTPIGDRGDQIIQKLADRLAAVDLLDRATQLLEHQIKFRVSGEDRARVGARLALLHLLNKQPQRALEVMETTNYGSMPDDLRLQRQQLTAQALDAVGKHEEALSLLFHDQSPEGALLRLDVLWHMQDWPNVINQGEDILAARPNLTDPLNEQETVVLLKLSLAYSFEGDNAQLKYLRDYYTGLLPDNRYKEIFDFITNDTNPLDAEDFALLSGQINRTESFLGTFRDKIAAGRLSEAIK